MYFLSCALLPVLFPATLMTRGPPDPTGNHRSPALLVPLLSEGEGPKTSGEPPLHTLKARLRSPVPFEILHPIFLFEAPHPLLLSLPSLQPPATPPLSDIRTFRIVELVLCILPHTGSTSDG